MLKKLSVLLTISLFINFVNVKVFADGIEKQRSVVSSDVNADTALFLIIYSDNLDKLKKEMNLSDEVFDMYLKQFADGVEENKLLFIPVSDNSIDIISRSVFRSKIELINYIHKSETVENIIVVSSSIYNDNEIVVTKNEETSQYDIVFTSINYDNYEDNGVAFATEVTKYNNFLARIFVTN